MTRRERSLSPGVTGPVATTERARPRQPPERAGQAGASRSAPTARNSDAEYRAIFEASSDGLVVNDLDTGMVLAANPAFCRMHGYDHMAGLHPSTFIHPSSQPLFAAFLCAVRAGQEFRCQAQDIRQDGTVFDVEVLGRTFTYRGQPATLGVVRDVTERVRAYEVLEQRVAERTREIEQRRQVAEGMRELLAVVNSKRPLDQVLDDVVRQAGRLLGSDAEALYLLDERDPSVLRLQASHNLPLGGAPPTVASGTPTMGLATARGRPVVAPDLPRLLAEPFAATVDEQILDRGAYLELVRRGPTSAGDPLRQRGNRVIAELFRSEVAVPLVARGTCYGALMLAYRARHVPSDDELGLIAAFTSQAGLAIENARLHEQADQRLAELDALYQADELLHRSLRLDDVLQALADVAATMLRADKTSVLVWDAEHARLAVRAAHGFASETIAQMSFAPGEGISTRVAASGQPIAVYDVRADPRIPPRIRAINEAAAIRSLVSVPITLSGQVFGVFNVNCTEPRTFSDSDLRVLAALAQRAALAIQNARLHEDSERRRQELEGLYQAEEALHRSLRLQDVLEALVDTAVDLLHADGGGLWAPNPASRGRVEPMAARGFSAEYLQQTLLLSDDPAVLKWWWDNESFSVQDIAHDPRIPSSQRAALQREGYNALLTTQVRVGDEVFGSFTVGHRTSYTFSDAEKRLLSLLAQRAALAIQNARLYEQAQQAATLEERQRLARELHDAVTQTLFSTALIAEVLPELWDQDRAEGRQRLAELRRLTRGALAEMRTLLVELRPGALTELPLGDLLRQLADATTGRTRLEVVARVDGQARPLPPAVQVALYRIAQEALNNVVKHAQARHATLTLSYDASGDLRLRVEDDGRGFDPSVIPAGHLGVGIMRERADAIGARLDLSSRSAAGTVIEVHWQQPEGAAP